MKKLNPKAIAILREVMTLEERKEFCKEFGMDRMPSGESTISVYEMTISRLLNIPSNSFLWCISNKGQIYWDNIFNRFTTEQLNTLIYL